MWELPALQVTDYGTTHLEKGAIESHTLPKTSPSKLNITSYGKSLEWDYNEALDLRDIIKYSRVNNKFQVTLDLQF